MSRTIVTLLTMFLGLDLLLTGGCASSVPHDLAQKRTPTSWVSSASDQPADVRVMTFNLRRPVVFDGLNHWGFRKDTAAATINAIKPDVVGTQECVLAQAETLAGALPEYQWVGAGRNNGHRSGEMTAVFFRTDRMTLIDHGHFWFCNTPDKPGKRAWGAWWPRMSTWAQLQDHRTGRSFFVFNAHLSAVSSRARRKSAAMLKTQIQLIAGDQPVVVLGDFNTGTDSTPYATLTADGQLQDAFRTVHPQPQKNESTHHKFRGKTKGERIDWVLATGQLRPTHAGIVNQKLGGRWVSDHFPVVADLAWDTTPSTPTLMAGAGDSSNDEVIFNSP